jgi:hypothetical protein
MPGCALRVGCRKQEVYGFDAATRSPLEGYRSQSVPISVLEAVKLGLWDYEPPRVDQGHYSSTRALPGSTEKLAVLAERLKLGLPLWHPNDPRNYADAIGEHED